MTFRTPPGSQGRREEGDTNEVDFLPPSGKLAAVTRKGNELRELITQGVTDQNKIELEYQCYVERITKLKEACDNQENLTEDSQQRRTTWWSENYSSIVQTRIDVEKYMQQLTGAIAKKQKSAITRRSSVSLVSKTSSARVKLAERKAKLIAEKAFEKTLIDLEDAELKHKRKLRETETAKLELEQSILEKELDKLDTIADRIENTCLEDPFEENSSEGDSKENEATFMKKENNGNENNKIFEVLRKQNEISSKIAKHQEKAELPKREVPVFDGEDITKYQSFIQNFNRTIKEKCDNEADCLYYLEQFTAGAAKQLVKSCSQSNASHAFRQALDLLDDEYNNEYRTATAYIRKLEEWPSIKSEDNEGLHNFSIYLLTCANNMETMTSLNQLNSPKEMMNVIMKLPFELRKKWRVITLDLSEKKSPVTFRDLVKFVRKQAKLLNQPLFGAIKDSTKPAQKDWSNNQRPNKRILITKTENNVTTEENRGHSPSKFNCIYCKKTNHELNYCFFFKKLTLDEKLSFLKKSGRCYSCLAEGHTARGCVKRLTCTTCQETSDCVT